MRNFFRKSSLFGILFAMVTIMPGCAEEDGTAPPAPWVDEVRSPTSLSSQVLTGSAEYGSTVTVSGGAEIVTTMADSFTADFLIEVPLNQDAENSLSVTTTDSAGNISDDGVPG